MIIYYMPDDCGELLEFTVTDGIWRLSDPLDLEALTELCAEDYGDNHDGWESNWPLEFDLYDDSKTLIAKHKVEREYQPEYTAKTIDMAESRQES